MGLFSNYNRKNLFAPVERDKKREARRRRYNTIIAPMNRKKRDK